MDFDARAELIISIHGSREGPDIGLFDSSDCADLFQSTGPVRDPTSSSAPCSPGANISIHGSREGPDGKVAEIFCDKMNISIHGSREGPDKVRIGYIRKNTNFNPRVP